mgnify:CR=1 FL=1
MRLRKKPWIEEAMQDLKGEYVLMHDLENYKGRWQELFPGKRLCLEIGCGKGRFIIGMAELHPEKAFIGVETQHDIAYYPGKTAKENKMDNIKVICANAEHMEDWFEPGEIKELYLNFSDPWPKARHAGQDRAKGSKRCVQRPWILSLEFTETPHGARVCWYPLRIRIIFLDYEKPVTHDRNERAHDHCYFAL